MTRIYLSGQIQGIEFRLAQQLFAKAAIDVMTQVTDDVEIINPTTLPQTCDNWADYLLRDLLILKGCDVIAMLPNWEASHGAKTEHEFALGCNIKVIYLK